jgi:hypothetical protein
MDSLCTPRTCSFHRARLRGSRSGTRPLIRWVSLTRPEILAATPVAPPTAAPAAITSLAPARRVCPVPCARGGQVGKPQQGREHRRNSGNFADRRRRLGSRNASLRSLCDYVRVDDGTKHHNQHSPADHWFPRQLHQSSQNLDLVEAVVNCFPACNCCPSSAEV